MWNCCHRIRTINARSIRDIRRIGLTRPGGEYELVVIGGGPTGLVSAITAAVGRSSRSHDRAVFDWRDLR
jgi:NADPH-dependent 2,4-dienoyl-CoA reductase/sulfur reductase-like enzyme